MALETCIEILQSLYDLVSGDKEGFSEDYEAALITAITHLGEKLDETRAN